MSVWSGLAVAIICFVAAGSLLLGRFESSTDTTPNCPLASPPVPAVAPNVHVIVDWSDFPASPEEIVAQADVAFVGKVVGSCDDSPAPVVLGMERFQPVDLKVNEVLRDAEGAVERGELVSVVISWSFVSFPPLEVGKSYLVFASRRPGPDGVSRIWSTWPGPAFAEVDGSGGLRFLASTVFRDQVRRLPSSGQRSEPGDSLPPSLAGRTVDDFKQLYRRP